jgi:L-rhamnose mutarotase
MPSKQYCLALDLKEDETLIAQYEHYHRPENIWPEIEEGIKACNILDMQIYRVGNRLFMILETNESFEMKRDFAKMASLPRQKEWAELMLAFQQRLPFAQPDELWMEMKPIFRLKNCIK